MEESSERHATQDIGSGVAGKPGISYDSERLGDPGQPESPREINILVMKGKGMATKQSLPTSTFPAPIPLTVGMLPASLLPPSQSQQRKHETLDRLAT